MRCGRTAAGLSRRQKKTSTWEAYLGEITAAGNGSILSPLTIRCSWNLLVIRVQMPVVLVLGWALVSA